MSRSRRALLVLATLGCCVAVPARAEVPAQAREGAWSEVRTPHVRVLGDAGEERVAHVAERLERLHEEVERTLPALASGPARPLTAFVFARGGAYRDYLPRYGGAPENAAGLFQPGPRGDALLLEDAPDPELDRVALHEATHALLCAVAPDAPLWLAEGLAEYWSTLRVDAADARVGEPIPAHVAWLRAHELLPADALFGMDRAAPDYHAGERRRTFYAESWLLVHLLLTGGRADLPRWDGYLAALHRGAAPRAAFAAAFGDEPQVFRRLELYVRAPSYGTMAWSFAQPFSALALDARAHVPAPEVLVALAGLLAARPEGIEAAREHVRAALALAPDDAQAAALLAALDDAPGTAHVVERAADGSDREDRRQRAIGAYNTGVAAYDRGELGRARESFRAAAALADEPGLAAKVGHALAVVADSGVMPEVDRIDAALRDGRRGEARRRVAGLLAADVSPTLRRGLERLAAALEAAR